jgi:hypothetical protein
LKGTSTMADIRPLERTLSSNVAWNKARINFLAKFLVALIQVKTVNLVQVACAFSGRAKPDSHYKRIQRFLSGFDLCYATIARFVVKLADTQPPWVITMDRTDWYFGQTPLNILTLGIVHQGIAFPLLWVILEKKGCSATAERIALLEEFDRLFGFAAMAHLCADREFIGKDWFAYLAERQIDFRIRLRANTKISNVRGQMRQAGRLFAHLRVGQSQALPGKRRLLGVALYVSGMRVAGGEFLIIARAAAGETAMQDYAKRWEIETLFGCLKSRGFCLEQTHVTEAERLKKLVALMALAFCWAHVVGEWLSRQKPLPVKKHGRKARSIFRYGFDHLRRLLCNLSSRTQQIAFRQVIQLLSCT